MADQPGDTTQSPETMTDPGLACLCLIAGYYRVPADPAQLKHQLALLDGAKPEDTMRGARLLGLKARIVSIRDSKRLGSIPYPALLFLKDGGSAVLAAANEKGKVRLVDSQRRSAPEITLQEAFDLSGSMVLLVTRRLGGAGTDPGNFGFFWFLPSLLRYRKALAQVFFASLFIQVFALITPLFFQLVVDKVLVHKGLSTLTVLVIGLLSLGFFESMLQFLRSYTLNHTTNRIDVELGRRLFHHLFRLPVGYFETRPAGQTVARMRELETIRSFLTGQGLTAVLDLLFTLVFVGVLFVYSTKLTIVILSSIPIYLLIALVLRPILRQQIDEKFNRGARAQQFLVESIVGAQTLKAASVEPMMQSQWEERLASYVSTSFDATVTGSLGQGLIQYVSKAVNALILFLGAGEVIDGTMSVGELIAFNMIAAQVVQPVLRLSQLWQDFQQVQVSVARLGDILNSPPEPIPQNLITMPPTKGSISFRNVTMRYRPDTPDVLRSINLDIASGEVVGIVGTSGSGKSTLSKMVQRLYSPTAGQVLLDGVDIAQLDPGWLRRQIGVVLQENILFNRTIHENIALSDPAMPRAFAIQAARLAGADEFISQMPQGYDTMIEERGANLSGGQRQRIAIARALSTNPRILIFDEATSALDYESERIIQDNMRAIAQGRTVIIIAHRLAALRPCHRIMGMAKGEIIEAGTHAQLLSNPKGLYAGLWMLQMDQAGRPE
jgi:subfamily B ATP-binding cassette protein HlyB/CyaB